ncbi:formyltetrahydrofolate deformylase [Govanella unica]|uniref:Formyltetrahydrofolate deformylase n=1 Tax=Govanella unica TaxID=2975056 RepID=A0A9X3TZA4_9PROT|nr:formyltetrahydrofolate deformylase [Govania unica]MDA5194721.1 formyltetrahydrofolate deformylase [Govania unica]
MPVSTPDLAFVLTLSCPNRVGIVYAVSKFLFERGLNITDSAQYDDLSTGRFFMRVAFAVTDAPHSRDELQAAFATVAEGLDMVWTLRDRAVKPRVMILVSKFDHCLIDLLYRTSIGELDMEIPAIVSNHRDAYQLAAAYDIPFHHLPVSRDNKEEQEDRLLDLARREAVDLIVLARYMQILSDRMCASLPCPAINIHHSFLPSFKGAMPYHQAHKRGVKLIGATAHYVTPDLDEGPIIEQDIARVTHAMTPEDLIAVGRDTEKLVLARAVRLHIEDRILPNDHKTVVFR